MKANAHKSEVKEIRFTPNTDDHDFDFKAKHAEKFLKAAAHAGWLAVTLSSVLSDAGGR